MKALIRKDFYVLKKQFLLFAVIVVVFRLGNNSASTLISILYAVMLPSSAFAYDDLSHWDAMEQMLPYSTRQIVLSRYCVGWLSMMFIMTLGWLIQLVMAWARPDWTETEDVRVLVEEMAIAAIFLALTMPTYFRFSAEKSRFLRMLIIFLVAGLMGGGMSLVAVRYSALGDASLDGDLARFLPAVCLAAVVVTAVSVPLSMLAWRRRHR